MKPLPDTGSIADDVLDAVDVGLILLDAGHVIRTWNTWMERTSGLGRDATLGRKIWSLLPALSDTRLHDAVREALELGTSSLLSHTLNPKLLPLRLPDGRALLHSAVVRPLDAGAGRNCLVQVTDVTTLVERERLLRERRDARFRAIVDTAQEAIVTTDVTGRVQWANRAAELRFGYDLPELVDRDVGLLLTPEDADRWPRGEAARSWESPGAPLDLAGRQRDGTRIALTLSLGRWVSEGRVFLTGILHDVTDRQRAREALERALDDKTVLLREVNHRVKNSLQLVSGLLNLQVAAAGDETIRHHLRDAAHRISAVAQVHQRLYRADQFHSLDFGSLLTELCDDLAKGAGGPRAIVLEVDAGALELPVDHAVPLGLIANELVTNAIKHGKTAAQVRVSLTRQAGGLLLTVADQGPGLPAGFDPGRSSGLGMRIVSALTRQLCGSIEIPAVSAGARFDVFIPLPAPEGPP
ncbi:PAS domain S-box protein [Arenibaculum sp.]|jgi:PAS domain S-box-containing protein|uniref:sensor histidine kinase n=1 Tax=Arenibaculum sp. TaxID=2865862 RepID=UPI002E0EBA56|nr:PAS domain S-box protein [Arenibaculum sp.]